MRVSGALNGGPAANRPLVLSVDDVAPVVGAPGRGRLWLSGYAHRLEGAAALAAADEYATLNPTGWLVHIEADGKDKGGAVVSYVIDGKIENLPLPNRTITGTWKSQKENGAFKIGRQ